MWAKIVVTKPILTYFQRLGPHLPTRLPLNNVVSLQNVSDLFSIASDHNISCHGKPTLNRGGEGRGEGGNDEI